MFLLETTQSHTPFYLFQSSTPPHANFLQNIPQRLGKVMLGGQVEGFGVRMGFLGKTNSTAYQYCFVASVALRSASIFHGGRCG